MKFTVIIGFMLVSFVQSKVIVDKKEVPEVQVQVSDTVSRGDPLILTTLDNDEDDEGNDELTELVRVPRQHPSYEDISNTLVLENPSARAYLPGLTSKNAGINGLASIFPLSRLQALFSNGPSALQSLFMGGGEQPQNSPFVTGYTLAPIFSPQNVPLFSPNSVVAPPTQYPLQQSAILPSNISPKLFQPFVFANPPSHAMSRANEDSQHQMMGALSPYYFPPEVFMIGDPYNPYNNILVVDQNHIMRTAVDQANLMDLSANTGMPPFPPHPMSSYQKIKRELEPDALPDTLKNTLSNSP